MKIDFTGVEESTGGTDRLDFGINEVTITGTTFSSPDWSGKPYVDITFVGNTGELVERFYLSAAALPKLKHLLINLGIDDKKISSELEDKQLESMITGKKVRILVTGREYQGSDGEVKTAKQLGFTGFAELITVPKEKSKLVFKENKYIKKIDGTFGSNNHIATKKYVGAEDIPF